MAFRPTWQGHLKLSLVTCPVALYTATESGGDIRFNLINPDTGNRIKMVTTDPETGPIDRSSLVKGYEVEKGQYVLMSEDELRSVRLESTRTINIERFVPAEDINRLYWGNPYFLAPDGDLALDAFTVIRDAMREAGQIALGRVVMSTRERLLALEPHGKGIVAYTLRTRDEVRKPDELFDKIPDAAPDAAMVSIARQIIQQAAGPFDPREFVDRYEEALKALIAEKRKGQPLTRSKEPQDTPVVDLMEALRASLQGISPSQSRGAKARRGDEAPKPAPRRKPGTRKAS